MKKQSSTLFAIWSTKDMANLTTEVKETIAYGAVVPGHKIFTAADLWNIRRQVKSRGQRKYL